MKFKLKEVPICANKEFEMLRITDEVRDYVAESGVENGVVFVITEHTTTGITVNESLPGGLSLPPQPLSPQLWHHRRQRAGTPEVPPHREPLCLPGGGRQSEAGERRGYLFLRIRWH